jgi:mRNA interferase MazF
VRGKVVLVSFPFDDLSSTKVRPAVCLTEPVGPHEHVVLAFITSQAPSELVESDVALSVADADFGKTGLRVSSTLRLHRLITLASSMLRRELGMIGPARQREIDDKLRRLFQLDGRTSAVPGA